MDMREKGMTSIAQAIFNCGFHGRLKRHLYPAAIIPFEILGLRSERVKRGAREKAGRAWSLRRDRYRLAINCRVAGHPGQLCRSAEKTHQKLSPTLFTRPRRVIPVWPSSRMWEK